jgi:branched-chain amino acid transport system ATP-binding protein
VLNFGTVLASGSPSEVRNDPGVIEAYLGHSSARDEALVTTQTRKKRS